jgi:integrase
VSARPSRRVLPALGILTAARILAVLRLILGHAVADGRVIANSAAAVKIPSAGKTRREGRALTRRQLYALRDACTGDAADLVLVLGLTGLRWGELAGLRVGDLVDVPGRGLRVQRAVLASRGGGELYVDSVKNRRARTVPLVAELVPIVDRWAAGKDAGDTLFTAPAGGLLRESNWKRGLGWREAIRTIGQPSFRVHDLRHTAASIWLASGADPKVVQAILGHATASMTMDLYGHLLDANLWSAAKRVEAVEDDFEGTSREFGGTTGARADFADYEAPDPDDVTTV